MAKQGKCPTCHRTFTWPTDIPLANAICPTDKVPLKRTVLTHSGMKDREAFSVTTSDVERIPSHHRTKASPQLGELSGPGSD